MLTVCCREALAAQLDLAETKAESEELARALLEEQYFELTQESKKAASRNRQEISDRDNIVSRVSYCDSKGMLYVYPNVNAKLASSIS